MVRGLVKLLAATTKNRADRYWRMDDYFTATADTIPELPVYSTYREKTYRALHALKLPYAALALLKQLPEDERREAERNVASY